MRRPRSQVQRVTASRHTSGWRSAPEIFVVPHLDGCRHSRKKQRNTSTMVVSWSASDRSSGPRSLAVWESEQTSRRWGGTEKRTQRRRDLLQHATCSKHCHLPTLPHQLQNVSRMSIVNPSAPRSPTIPARPPYQIDGSLGSWAASTVRQPPPKRQALPHRAGRDERRRTRQ